MLFTASLVIGFWLDTVVSPYAAFRSLLVGVAAAATVTLLLTMLLRSRDRAGIAASGLIGILYSKHLVEIVSDLQRRVEPWLFALWTAMVVAALGLTGRLLLKTARSWTRSKMNYVLNRVSILLLAATIGTGIVSGGLAHGVDDLGQGMSLDEALRLGSASSTSSNDPDVYLVLLDGYPRVDVLDHAFEIDNRPFVDALEERGFAVATESHSDYLWTQQSLTSMLHMAYIEDIPRFMDVLERRAPYHPTLRRLVNSNPVFDLARVNGYQIVATGAGFEQVALRDADVYVDGGHLNEFEIKLLTSTFLGDMLAVVAPDLASGAHRDRIEFELRALGEIAAAERTAPRLVFAHIPAPHQPTVFRRDGSPVTVPISRHFYADSPQERGEPADEFVRRYGDQLEYLNQRIMETVDAIVANSNRPPVIVLWADHGSASRVDWLVTAAADADPDIVLERTGTLFAALTPGRTGVFPNDVSPASIFRYLADRYFGTDYGRATPPFAGGHVPPVDSSALDAASGK
ncbi:MAG: hypothetical protein M3153_06380 [Chloroflexota bacterium]|nr:hypothetical protein [Chloroflexota bacterium]